MAGSTSVFWAGDRPYGAYYSYESGNLPGTPAEHQIMGHHFVYEGHYPVKTKDHPDEWVWWEWGDGAAPLARPRIRH